MKKQCQKSVISEELIVNVFLLLCVIGLAIYASTWPYKPKLMPLGICIVVAILLLRQVIVTFRNREETRASRIPWKLVASFAAFGIMIPITWLTSLVPSVGLLGASLAYIYGERRWWVIILVGIVCSVLMYLIFGQIFRIPMTF